MMTRPITQAIACLLVLQTALPTFALPQGWQVISGQVNFNQSGNTLTVSSASQTAIVEYISFNLANGETVNFILPNASSGILNRVVGSGTSLIAGNLMSNGQFALVNSAGIQVANTAQLNAAGLLLSTLNISNSSYLSGTYALNEGNTAGKITNEGVISTQAGGNVVLAGGENQ